MKASGVEKRWREIIPIVEEFQSYISPFIARLQIFAANDKLWSMEKYHEQDATGMFNKRGVYLIFDRHEKLQYVGVTTTQFHDRIWKHDDDVERRWTDIIPFEDTYYFLALALERLLIDRLQPPENQIYGINTSDIEQDSSTDSL